MKLKEMVPGIRYIVTKGGNTLSKGETVYIDGNDMLACPNSGGWLLLEEWTRLRNEVQFNSDYYSKELDKARTRVRLLESLIDKHGEKK